MLLAMLVVAIAFIVGITFLANSSSAMGASRLVSEHAQARQIAESALALAAADLEANPDWRATRVTGVWVDRQPLFDGTATITTNFAPETPPAALTPDDPGFEDFVGQLATPLLGPPMSGTIGEWTVERTALLPTGPTVPTIGVEASANATQGSNAAFITFGLSVVGTGIFSQSLATPLAPYTRYELQLDITVATGLPDLTFGARVLAGSALIASTENAWTFALPADPGQLPQLPQNPGDPTQYQALITYAGLGAGLPTAYTLTFVTDQSPPPGNIVIELFAESTGVLASVWFDNVRFSARSNEPIELTAVGRFGDASHAVVAEVISGFDGASRIISWSEP